MSAERQRGFTLFEVLVVLAIIGLVAAVMAPAVFRGFAGTQARAAAYQIAAALRQARGEAVAENADVAVVFDVARQVYAVERASANVLPRGVRLDLYAAEVEQLDATTGAIRFFPDGSATGGQVTVGDEVARYQVNVDWLTGRISVVEAQGGQRAAAGNQRWDCEEANADGASVLTPTLSLREREAREAGG